MKVRIFAFEWFMGGGITLDEFSNYLKSLSGLESEHKLLALSKKDDYWTGVLISIKDITAYCQMKREGGSFTIEAQHLDANAQIADFNFFILNTTTGRGLYQHYHQSPVSNTFSKFIQKQYLRYRKQRIDAEIAAAGGEEIKKTDEKKIKSKYYGGFGYKTVLKQKDFVKCVEALKQIKMFSFELESISAEEKLFTPASEFAKRCSHRFFFQEDKPIAGLRDSISRTIKGGGVKIASVKGIDEFDEDVVYKLVNDYAKFEEYEYNDIIGSVSFKSGNLEESLSKSKLVEELLSIAERSEVKVILTAKAK
jgi:hypothetical protein